MAEMLARVSGDNGWLDPHNAGTYAVSSSSDTSLSVSRTTRNGAYIDLIAFELESSASGGCVVSACSESQVTSIADFSTNFCTRTRRPKVTNTPLAVSDMSDRVLMTAGNMHNLYCGSAEGCPVASSDFDDYSEKISASMGAGSDKTACVAAGTSRTAQA